MRNPTAILSESETPETPLAFALSDVRLADLRGVVRLERLCFTTEAWGWIDFTSALVVRHIFRKAVAADRLLGFIVGAVDWNAGVTWIVTRFRGSAMSRAATPMLIRMARCLASSSRLRRVGADALVMVCISEWLQG